MIAGEIKIKQPIENNLAIYHDIGNIVTGQRNVYATYCLLEHYCFIEAWKIPTIDFRKKQVLDVNTKARQQVSFNGNLN